MSAGLFFFLHTSTKTRVAAVSAREYQSSIPGGAWEMANTVYCLEEAPVDFDEHFGKVSEDLCGEFGSLCLTRLDVRACCISIKAHGVMMCKHMDDGVLVGPDEALDRTLTAMGKILLSKTSCPQLGSETKFLGRLDQDGKRISGQASCKTLRQSVVQCWFGELRSCAFSWCAIGIASSE